jgi:hypothetical protein
MRPALPLVPLDVRMPDIAVSHVIGELRSLSPDFNLLPDARRIVAPEASDAAARQ